MKNIKLLSKNNLSRRNFVKTSALAIAGMSMASLPSEIAYSKTKNSAEFNVIMYNVLKCTGWPSDRQLTEKARELGQMPLRFALELSQYKPDIITFAESPEESVIKEIAELLDMNYTFFPSAGAWPGVVFTPHTIIQSDNVPIIEGKQRPEDLFTRHWGRAVIQNNAGLEIVVHSIHLYPHNNPTSQAIREREISLILEAMDQDIKNGKNMLISGDLNHLPDTPEHSMWLKKGWKDTFVEAGIGDGSTIPVNVPARRIDYVMVNGPIADALTRSKALFEGAFRVDPDDPVSYALSDHLPQLATFDLSKM